MRRAIIPFVVLGALATSTPANAQPVDPPSATELFRQGREALDAKDYATACPKLEASLHLDPHVGTLISLAECEEASGRIAAARGHWQQASDLAHGIGDKRESFAAERFAAIDPRVPRLTLRRAPGPPRSMTVIRDDVDLGAPSFDVPLPVEPGTHVVVVRTEGFEPGRVTVTLAEREAKELMLEPGAALPPPPEPIVIAPPVVETPTKPSVQRPVAIGFAGAAVLAVGLGTAFGLEAIHGKSLAPADPARSTALADGDVSTAAFIAAGAFVATAATLWLTAPKAAKGPRVEVTPVVRLGGLGVAIRGSL